MKLLIQRVDNASVIVDGQKIASICKGLLVYFGVHEKDKGEVQLPWMVKKLINLRIFEDEEQKMNASLSDVNGELLVVSQFTLHADLSKGMRPSFAKCMPPQRAKQIYDLFIEECSKRIGKSRVQSGSFGAIMQVQSVNSGPATFVLDYKNTLQASPS